MLWIILLFTSDFPVNQTTCTCKRTCTCTCKVCKCTCTCTCKRTRACTFQILTQLHSDNLTVKNNCLANHISLLCGYISTFTTKVSCDHYFGKWNLFTVYATFTQF